MADSSNYLQPSIPKFDGHYDHWSMLMENLLRSKEYWSLIEDGVIEAPAGATQDQIEAARESKLKDLKANNFLFQAIERSILETILTRGTAKEIWDSMRQKYCGSTKVKRAQLQALRKEFEMLNMRIGESIDEYFSRTLSIANKMTSHGDTITQSTIVEKILRSLTSRFNYVVCSIEESNDTTTMTVDQLQSSLLVQEQRMKHQKDEQEQILKVSNGGRGSGGRGDNSNARGRGRGRGRRGRGAKFNKELVECYKCHKLGHFQSECPSWEEDNANYAEYAEFDDRGEILLMAQGTKSNESQDSIISDAKNELWFLDSGCSNHMVGNKNWLFEYDGTFKDSVKLGDDSKMAVEGKGNLKLHIEGFTQVLTNVYYLPGLKNNLLSIGQLQQKNLTVIFKNDTCKVFHEEKGLIMATHMTMNRMFVIKAPVIVPHCMNASSDGNDNANLWHQRYGHLSFKGMNVLAHKEMVIGLPKLKQPKEECSNCMKGKQQRQNVPKKSSWRASTKLELVHSDICGPINPESNGRKRYFITFTDDLSRRTWIYFMNEKSEALAMFKKFKVMVENEAKESIQCLRTDRGGEYTSNEFSEFCDLHGIKRQLTAAYTPHQNRVSERKNRTIMNMVRCMLSERSVPKTFWPEAVNWSVYLLNRSPTFAVKDVTPEEAWSGIKPSVSHFKIFGCIAYVHIPDNLRKKLDDKSIICVHLGISEESKAYKLFDPLKKRILVSKDVRFDEKKQWNWENKVTEKSNSSQQVIDCEIDVETCSTSSHHDHSNDAQVHAPDDASNASNPLSEEMDLTVSDSEEEVNELGKRVSRKPSYLNDYEVGDYEAGESSDSQAFFSPSEDPMTYNDAAKHDVWKKAMDTEIAAIESNDTWELTHLPAGAKKIGVKWVYKTKYNEEGKIEKHKARLVAKGYSQQHGIDYNEVFAPVARWDTIRTILAIAATNHWYVFQLDVKSAFLHGELDETVYVEQPLGYQKKEKEMVYRLKKSLYGLKQAPRAWYSKIEAYFCREGFVKCTHEHTLFVKKESDGRIIIVSLYVDDLIFTGNDQNLFDKFKTSMERNFAMTDLGKMRYFLGIEVKQTKEGIFMFQQKYACEVLKRFNMESCNSVCNPIVPGNKLKKDEDGIACDSTSYKQMVGCLMYLLATRPDLAFSVCLVARFMERPTELHVAAVKRILRYVKGTVSYGLWFEMGKNDELVGWSDSDYAGDLDDRKSTSGYVFMIGSKAVSWCSKKQPIVTLSTTEAEFIAAANCACQAIWLSRILDHISSRKKDCITLYCDNSSTIKLSKNPVMHGRSKHIDVRFHFLRDLTKDGKVQLLHCSSFEQTADIMTKALSLESFCKFRDMLGLCKLEDIN
ncbi:unnamed protein product [Trifolium pratense]|uniref:Uncharacterized protein n=1 Tax=Trifolium pratense TaxID=57577 RepID=A0ACB0JUD7_TRIPR|nr:unnamed protein product [Trifolium pratense]